MGRTRESMLGKQYGLRHGQRNKRPMPNQPNQYTRAVV